MGRRSLGTCALLALVMTGACGRQSGFEERALTRETAPAVSAPSTVPPTLPPTTTPPTAPPTTTPPPPPPPPAASRTLAAVRLPAGVDAYRGLATWVDVYDWTREFTRGGPLVGPGDVDAMADRGVQTLYIQTSKWNSPNDVVDPDLLVPIIERAHARKMKVIAWYLPTLEDLPLDLRRLVAGAHFGVDGVAVDIESKKVANVAERNRRLVVLSDALRKTLPPGHTIGGIVLPPVVLDVINPHYWPSFPWRQIAPFYDVWLPMGYWTNRTAASGYRDSYRYADENITRLRQHLGLPSATVHYVGGIADATTPADIDGMNRVIAHHGAIGGSLYDWRTTAPGLWPYLQPLRWKP